MQRISRRGFLQVSTVGVTHLLEGRSTKPSKKSPPRKRRLLFNWDGSMIHCYGRTTIPKSRGPLTRDQFVSLVFTPIERSAVDAVLFSFGSGNVAEYQSQILEWPGQADDFEFPEKKTWYAGVEVDPKDQYFNPKSLADAGHNPPAIVVEECHRRGLDAFVSLRMNDCHDALRPQGTLPNPELPTFKRINPDWLNSLNWWTALNYTKPQVRLLKRRVIEEFFDRWDFDGIELDWLRHTLNFPRGTERENGKHLTQFMRDVRQSLNQRAARRGRPIEIAVRIPERLDWCLDGGFEVPTWISEDLVDILILGQGLTEAPALQEFRNLTKVRPLSIYPCVYMYGNGYRICPDEVIRGNAANLWRDGADGLYLFNWHTYGPWRRHLLDEITSVGTLRSKTKHYTLTHGIEASPFTVATDAIRYNTALRVAALPMALSSNGESKTLWIPVADIPVSKNNPATRAELWLALDYSRPGDVLNLSLNGRTLSPKELDVAKHWQSAGFPISIPPGNGILGLPLDKSYDTRFQAVRIEVPLPGLIAGRNKLEIQLKARGAGSDKSLRLSRVELLVQC
ncbi:MAG: hypothetical protein EXQ58_00790 [Acidobacteria bacterium]|nr:hypothetical protein [Acidobacteriota bacterium]